MTNDMTFTAYSDEMKDIAIRIIKSFGLEYNVSENDGIYGFVILCPDFETSNKVFDELWNSMELPVDVAEALDNMIDDAYKYDM